MSNILTQIATYDEWLTKEISEFGKAADFCMAEIKKGKRAGKSYLHCAACRDSYKTARAIFRALCHSAGMTGEERLHAYFIQLIDKQLDKNRAGKEFVDPTIFSEK